MHYEVREMVVIVLPILNKIRICNLWREAVYLNPTRLPSGSKITFQAKFELFYLVFKFTYIRIQYEAQLIQLFCVNVRCRRFGPVSLLQLWQQRYPMFVYVFQPFLFILYESSSAGKTFNG